MNIYEIDPTTDERWEDFLQSHPQASIFHTCGWLEALSKTYGYTPIAFTTSPPGSPLTNAIPFCKITGFFGRQRLVSLPFSDHCVPLVESQQQLTYLLQYVQEKLAGKRWNRMQIRASEAVAADPTSHRNQPALVLHRLDLRPSLDEIFRKLHPSCVQRKIRRAEREGLAYEDGTSDRLLHEFYQLLLMTRRRQGLPPQPIQWFRNLIACLGSKAKIHNAYFKGRAIASVLMLRYKQTLVYKYGCSDRSLNIVGGMQLLLWKAIQEASRDGLFELDMGRTELDNAGLVAFKDHWGTTREPLTYWEFPPQRRSSFTTRNAGIRKYVCSHAPDSLLAATGRVLYRHMG